MIARTIRVMWVSASEIASETGWTAPIGWRIVSSEKFEASSNYRVTLVKS